MLFLSRISWRLLLLLGFWFANDNVLTSCVNPIARRSVQTNPQRRERLLPLPTRTNRLMRSPLFIHERYPVASSRQNCLNRHTWKRQTRGGRRAVMITVACVRRGDFVGRACLGANADANPVLPNSPFIEQDRFALPRRYLGVLNVGCWSAGPERKC